MQKEKYKNREILAKIIRYLDIPEIIILHGSRQVGKTTLMKMVIDYLKNKEINDFFYLDLEKPEYLNLCNQGVNETIKYIKARLLNKKTNKKIHLFIDEIQYLDNPSSFLKLFYDHYKSEFKLIVSGSSSFSIKSKFKDSLVGRIIDIEIFGLTFQEFLDFKGLKYNLKSKADLIHQELKTLYKEYALYGAYPQVVLAEQIDLKELYLNNIIEKYIYKDIRDLAKIKEVKKFNNLLECLAEQAGQLVNLNELSNTLNISRQTIENYLFILENTYIVKLIHPFYKNIRSELTKMPKIYFEDSGILNILKNKKLSFKFDGALFENSIYNCLRKEFNVRDIYFWRTQNKQEVDFIIKKEQCLIPIEIKLNYNAKFMKSLIYFGQTYKTKKLYCAVYGKKECKKYPNISQLYPWEIMDSKIN